MGNLLDGNTLNIMSEDSYYIVTYKNIDEDDGFPRVSLKVKHIENSDLGLGFIRISGFVFSKDSNIVHSQDDRVENRYGRTKSLHIAINNIVSIEELSNS